MNVLPRSILVKRGYKFWWYVYHYYEYNEYIESSRQCGDLFFSKIWVFCRCRVVQICGDAGGHTESCSAPTFVSSSKHNHWHSATSVGVYVARQTLPGQVYLARGQTRLEEGHAQSPVATGCDSSEGSQWTSVFPEVILEPHVHNSKYKIHHYKETVWTKDSFKVV